MYDVLTIRGQERQLNLNFWLYILLYQQQCNECYLPFEEKSCKSSSCWGRNIPLVWDSHGGWRFHFPGLKFSVRSRVTWGHVTCGRCGGGGQHQDHLISTTSAPHRSIVMSPLSTDPGLTSVTRAHWPPARQLGWPTALACVVTAHNNTQCPATAAALPSSPPPPAPPLCHVIRDIYTIIESKYLPGTML